MFLPILFVIGFAIAGLKLGEKMRGSDFHVGGPQRARRQLPPARVSYRALVHRKVQLGHEVSDWLASEAMREAFDAKDWETLRWLGELFDEEEDAPEEQPPAEPAIVETAYESPLEGIDSDDWSSFCQLLATREAGHRSDRHIGKYDQSLSRLRHLGLEAPESEEDQYKAFAADMNDYWESEKPLISENAGEVVNIAGVDHPVTPSGILGLLKAAGPSGARSWLANEEDRVRFPRTTETFVRTNGCF